MRLTSLLPLLLLTRSTTAVVCLASLSRCPAVCTSQSTTQCECTDGRSACDYSYESCLNDGIGGCQDIVTTTLTVTPTAVVTSVVGTTSVPTGTYVSTDASTTVVTTQAVTVVTETKTITSTTTGAGATRTVTQTVTARSGQKRAAVQWSQDMSALLHPDLKLLVKRADRLTRTVTVTGNAATRVVPVTQTVGYLATQTTKPVFTSLATTVSTSTTTTTTTITVNRDGRDVTVTDLVTVTAASTTAGGQAVPTAVGGSSAARVGNSPTATVTVGGAGSSSGGDGSRGCLPRSLLLLGVVGVCLVVS